MPPLKKYTNNTITISADRELNCYLTRGLFEGTQNTESVLFGLQEDDGNFTGTLGDNHFLLDYNHPDCYGEILDSATGYDTTARMIAINVPKSDKTRTIIFSYNGTPLFTILQQKKSTPVTYTYKVFIRNIDSNGVYPSIVSNSTLTDSPSSWTTIKIESSIYPLCTMECYYTDSSDLYPSEIRMRNLYIAEENKAIVHYNGGIWNYGYNIKLFYFIGQKCILRGTYKLPFGKTNDDQHFDI